MGRRKKSDPTGSRSELRHNHKNHKPVMPPRMQKDKNGNWKYDPDPKERK